MIIRDAAPADYSEISELLTAAFTPEDIATFVKNLRTADEFLGELVAVKDGQILGYLGFAKAQLAADDTLIDTAMLTPLGVLPTHQNQGIGSGLVMHAHKSPNIRQLQTTIVLGHPEYYSKFGYAHDPKQSISSVWSAYPAFMIRGHIPAQARLEVSEIVKSA